MRILLINPEFPYRGGDKFPLGLGYLAGVLKEHELMVMDCSVADFSEKEVRRFSPELVCITSTTPSFRKACEYAVTVRNIVPDCTVVMGGVHATFRPHEALNYCDIVVRGEGEVTIVELVEALEKGTTLKGIKGVWTKDMKNPDREPIRDLDSIPFPFREIFPLEKYRIMSIVSSRGCPYSCAYCCATRFWGHRVRFRSPENVVSELREIYELGFKLVKFHDSTFTLNQERVKRICELIRSEDLDISWSCETRADHLNREILEVMKKAGCRLICIGVDSACENVLKRINRRIEPGVMEKAIKLAKSLGRGKGLRYFRSTGRNEKVREGDAGVFEKNEARSDTAFACYDISGHRT
ncbi:MAG: radical SAM protein [Candidatus Micrarchaeota archaeon]|nr:radical SAM protein [Candidatus Micrarchaeota archaeon]